MSKPFVVTFAGVPGSSKSIISQELSCEFRLPIFANDVVRSEVKEDMLIDDISKEPGLSEFEQRADERRRVLFDRGESFIMDNSVDRSWPKVKSQFEEYGFSYYLIDMELSREFMDNLYKHTNRQKARTQLDAYLKQHQEFMSQHSGDITLTITDETFKDRRRITREGLRRFMSQ